MLERMKSLIQEQDFNPGWPGMFLNPFYFARKGLARQIAVLAPAIRGRVLDVGCGSKPYRGYFNAGEYIGLEIGGRNKEADCYYDGKTFPFPSGEMDAVVTSEVLEHVFNPDEFLGEIRRVLKAGGLLLLTVPFLWDEHEQPFDYARYSSYGLRHLLARAGFDIVEQRKSMDDVRAIFQMINAFIYKKTITKHRLGNLLATLFLMAPFNLLGEALGWLLPRNADLYLDNIVLARKQGGSTVAPPPPASHLLPCRPRPAA